MCTPSEFVSWVAAENSLANVFSLYFVSVSFVSIAPLYHNFRPHQALEQLKYCAILGSCWALARETVSITLSSCSWKFPLLQMPAHQGTAKGRTDELKWTLRPLWKWWPLLPLPPSATQRSQPDNSVLSSLVLRMVRASSCNTGRMVPRSLCPQKHGTAS